MQAIALALTQAIAPSGLSCKRRNYYCINNLEKGINYNNNNNNTINSQFPKAKEADRWRLSS